jgi:GWxTD domain-containing protein
MRNTLGYFLMVCLLFSSMTVMSGNNSEKQGQLSRNADLNSYLQNWLEQDVGYIITDQERAAFDRLSNVEERLQFVGQFWARRKPLPDSLENEFKDEHYRRIAYVNEKYSKDTPGWKTDRGKIYILLGPPDWIDTSDRPSETWHYSCGKHGVSFSKRVDLEFLGNSPNGDYRLTLDSTAEALLNRFRNEIPREKSCEQSSLQLCPQGISHPPPIKYKDLETVLNSKLNYHLFPFGLKLASTRITDATVITSISFEFRNNYLTYQKQYGNRMLATVNIFGRVIDSTGQTRDEFESRIERVVPKPFFQEMQEGSSYSQKTLPLKSGIYTLEVAVKDLYSANVGTSYESIVVPDQK